MFKELLDSLCHLHQVIGICISRPQNQTFSLKIALFFYSGLQNNRSFRGMFEIFSGLHAPVLKCIY